MFDRLVNVVGIGSSGFKAKGFTLSSDYRSFRLNSDEATHKARFEGLNTPELPPRQQDFLDIATSIFIADQAIKRDQFTGDRRIGAAIPIRQINFWKGLEQKISAICEFLSGHPFNVYFYEGGNDVTHEEGDETMEADEVCCFSGGLDSLAGAHKKLIEERHLALASVWHGAHMKGIQDKLYAELEKIFGEGQRAIFSIRKKSRKQEGSMCTRSFLYLTVASVLAQHIGASKVEIPENGILALNVPISEGMFTTRTVHPIFLELYQKLIDTIFGGNITVQNSFQDFTKSEVVSLLKTNPELIALSNSCWQTWKTGIIASCLKRSSVKHCGYCYPCLIRRISVDSAGLSKYDAKYILDMYTDFSSHVKKGSELRQLQLNVLSLAYFCSRINSLDSRRLRDEFPEFEERGKQYQVRKAVKMYKRFGKEVRRVFRRRKETAFAEMATKFFS